MPMKPLSPLQAKMLRLALDDGAADGEALNALSMLRISLQKDGPDPHDLVDALQSAGFAMSEESPLPPASTKPDYVYAKFRSVRIRERCSWIRLL
jgi:hypothetical protein